MCRSVARRPCLPHLGLDDGRDSFWDRTTARQTSMIKRVVPGRSGASSRRNTKASVAPRRSAATRARPRGIPLPSPWMALISSSSWRISPTTGPAPEDLSHSPIQAGRSLSCCSTSRISVARNTAPTRSGATVCAVTGPATSSKNRCGRRQATRSSQSFPGI